LVCDSLPSSDGAEGPVETTKKDGFLNRNIGISTHSGNSVIANGLAFLRRQERDWKVTVIRTSLDKLAYQMVFPYLSIYIVALGATGTQLGLVNSIGMALAGLCAPFTGWFIDRLGPKRVYLVGIGFVALSYLTYGMAQDWGVTVFAMIAYWMGFAISTNSCATVCGNCLVNRDRATGMLICETVAAGLLGMVGPMLATWMVALFGGVNPGGIRPLFFSGLIVTIGTFIIVWDQLSDHKWSLVTGAGPDLFRGISQVLEGGTHLKKWLVIASVSHLPLGMVFPFTQVFAHTIKGAGEFVLGAMVTGSALASIALAIPLGRLADRIGRKKVLYITIPLFWISNLLLVWAPSQPILIVAGVLQGFYFIGASVIAAIERELVPREQMGRWVGVNRLFKMVLGACLALTAGFIWDRLGPQFTFLIFVAIDCAVRMPLLIRMPETLHARLAPKTEEK